jgi:hypothetical protein
MLHAPLGGARLRGTDGLPLTMLELLPSLCRGLHFRSLPSNSLLETERRKQGGDAARQ